MERFVTPTAALSLVCAATLLGCSGSTSSGRDAPDGAAMGATRDGSPSGPGDGGANALDAGGGQEASGDGAPSDPPTEAGAIDPCGGAAFCDTFDSYANVATITDKQKLGSEGGPTSRLSHKIADFACSRESESLYAVRH